MSAASAARPIRFERALVQWRQVLGSGRVLIDPSIRDRYGRTMLKSAPKTLAVLRPRRAAEVPKLLHIARNQRVSLYPISRGKNWGWGEACPVTEGQVVLDLGDLDRILEINAELGYAVVEPGVTQGQLVRALAEQAPEWWLESTNAGAETSIVGNALERGLGVNDRTASVCGIEAVLADGKTVRTGFGNFPRSRVTHVAKWGVGPNLDGLFSQSNLGVVTRMGLWLAPKPSGAESCLISVPASALSRLIDALRPLRLRGVLPTNVHVFPAQGRNGRARWLAVGVIHGSTAVRTAYRSEIQAAVAKFGRAAFFAREPDDLAAALQALDVRANPGIDDLFRAGAALCAGKLFSPSPKFLLAYLGGAKVQKTTGVPTSADPLVNDYGLYFLWVTCPAVGRDVEAAIGLVSDVAAKLAFRPQLTVQLPNGRAAVLVVRICFNRRDAKERGRASRCYKAVLEATTRAGFPPWRLGIEGMDLLKQRGIDMGVPRKLKALMDPDAVLAPGRYV